MTDKPYVIVVGDVMVDVSVEARALIPGGDVRGEVGIRPGGSGANAAVWAAAEGARVTLIGRVGPDLSGRLLADSLRERGVEPVLVVDPTAHTGTMLIVHQSAERSMIADRGANARLSPSDLPEELAADGVLVSGYLLYDAGSEAAGRAALDRASAPIVAVDAASWPLLEAYGARRFFAATSTANLLLANEREAQVLFGPGALEDPLRLDGPYALVCVKRGPRGAFLMAEGKAVHATAANVGDTVDPTGAGDAFGGVLVAALAGGASSEVALERACTAGARVTASSSTWPAR